MTLVLDTSAISAVALGEPDAERYAATLVANAGDVLVSAATYVEAGIVLQARLGEEGTRSLEEVISACRAQVVPLDAEQAALAVAAWARFGQGRHPA